MTPAIQPIFDPADHLRPPPHSEDAERALLGALMLNNAALDAVAGFLEAEHFFVPEYARLYGLIKTAVESGRPANTVALGAAAAGDPVLAAAGGPRFLAGVTASAVTIVNAEHYGRTIKDMHHRRMVIDACRAAIIDCYEADGETTTSHIVEGLDAKPFEVGALFSTVPERFMRGLSGRDDVAASRDAIGRMFLDTFSFNPTPQLLQPLIEQWGGKDSFTGRDIVPASLQSLMPEAQYTADTSEVARMVGAATGISPARIEHLIQGYTGIGRRIARDDARRQIWALEGYNLRSKLAA